MTAAAPRQLWMTDIGDRHEHAIVDPTPAQLERGALLALCEQPVHPGSVCAEPGPPCPGCVRAAGPRRRHRRGVSQWLRLV